MIKRNAGAAKSYSYDEGANEALSQDDAGYSPPELLCCCEYRQKGHEQGLHVAQHCFECTEIDSIIEECVCKCKLDTARCFRALQQKSLLPFPGGAHMIPLKYWCVIYPTFLLLLVIQNFFIVPLILGASFLFCCAIPFALTKETDLNSKKIDAESTKSSKSGPKITV